MERPSLARSAQLRYWLTRVCLSWSVAWLLAAPHHANRSPVVRTIPRKNMYRTLTVQCITREGDWNIPMGRSSHSLLTWRWGSGMDLHDHT